jgi:hypothetical protein
MLGKQMPVVTVPLVGMPATYHIGSDRYAYVVTQVTPSTIHVAHAEETADGRWIVRPGAESEKATKRRDGRYRMKGENFGAITLGEAENYRDPSF